MNPVIGIIGGMGPLATCDLMNKIIRFTDAKTDQQHIRICVDCNTNIPDRTEAILHHGKNPVPELVKSALRLEEMGAQLLVMSCNTAHYFYDDVMPYVDVPFMNMIEETAKYLKEHNVDTAAVFATDGTRDSGVYERVLSRAGIRVVYPSEENQKLLMSLILNGANLEPGGVKLSTQLPIVLGYGCCRLLSPFSHKARQNGALLGLMVNHPHIPPQALATLTMPALVIVGERDMIRDRHSQLIARSLPNAQFVRIPGGDHFCAAKCPEVFNHAVLSFLQNLPA